MTRVYKPSAFSTLADSWLPCIGGTQKTQHMMLSFCATLTVTKWYWPHGSTLVIRLQPFMRKCVMGNLTFVKKNVLSLLTAISCYMLKDCENKGNDNFKWFIVRRHKILNIQTIKQKCTPSITKTNLQKSWSRTHKCLSKMSNQNVFLD